MLRVHVAAIGKVKAGPERQLIERYGARFTDLARALGMSGIALHELSESPARRGEDRMAEEATRLASTIPHGAGTIVLDERGAPVDSAAFAALLRHARDRGQSDLVFVIGGADGLGPVLRAKADAMIGFGAMTIPHQLVRVLLYEQIYRAATLIAGHPYHR